MLQYKIPQNVGIEDKIVGPFSLRQLIIVAIGGGISYVIFAITSRIYELNILEYILMAVPVLFSLALAMLKIHNVSFGKYLLLMLEFAIKPKKRMWDHRGIAFLVAPDLSEKTSAKKVESQVEKEKKAVNLRSLSVTLDSGGFEHVQEVAHADIDEVTDDDLITEAYFGHKKAQSETENMYWRTRDMQKKKLELLSKMEQKSQKLQPAAQPISPVTSAQGTPSTEKKESVAEHLAGIIKEARQNNQAQQPNAVQATATGVESETKKKRRKRKKKAVPGPIRQNAPIDTTARPSASPKAPTSNQGKPGETSLNDLAEGGEIEFKLD